MKLLAFIFSALLISSAQAAVVLEVPTSVSAVRSEAKFEVNMEQNRAWVTLKQYEPRQGGRGAGPGQFTRESREKVPGLSYDEAQKAIILERDGAVVECATVQKRGRSIFRYNKITPTGCKLVVKKAKKAYDDGFHVRYVDVTQVHLIVK